jgi:hypothetical protein
MYIAIISMIESSVSIGLPAFIGGSFAGKGLSPLQANDCCLRRLDPTAPAAAAAASLGASMQRRYATPAAPCCCCCCLPASWRRWRTPAGPRACALGSPRPITQGLQGCPSTAWRTHRAELQPALVSNSRSALALPLSAPTVPHPGMPPRLALLTVVLLLLARPIDGADSKWQQQPQT